MRADAALSRRAADRRSRHAAHRPREPRRAGRAGPRGARAGAAAPGRGDRRPVTRRDRAGTAVLRRVPVDWRRRRTVRRTRPHRGRLGVHLARAGTARTRSLAYRRGASRGESVPRSPRREHPRHDLRQAGERPYVLPLQPRGRGAARVGPRTALWQVRLRRLPARAGRLFSRQGSGDLRERRAAGNPRRADLDAREGRPVAAHEEGACLRRRSPALPGRHLRGHHGAQAGGRAGARAGARAGGGRRQGERRNRDLDARRTHRVVQPGGRAALRHRRGGAGADHRRPRASKPAPRVASQHRAAAGRAKGAGHADLSVARHSGARGRGEPVADPRRWRPAGPDRQHRPRHRRDRAAASRRRDPRGRGDGGRPRPALAGDARGRRRRRDRRPGWLRQRAVAGRDRRRQELVGPAHSPVERARKEAVSRHQLRRAGAAAPRERAVRVRAGRVHRGDGREARSGRSGRRGHVCCWTKSASCR